MLQFPNRTTKVDARACERCGHITPQYLTTTNQPALAGGVFVTAYGLGVSTPWACDACGLASKDGPDFSKPHDLSPARAQ